MVERFNNTSVLLSYGEGDITMARGIRGVEGELPVLAETTIYNLCREGKMQFVMDGETYRLGAGEIFRFPKNATLTEYLFSPDYRCDFVGLTGRIADDVFLSGRRSPHALSSTNPILLPTVDQLAVINNLFDALYLAVESHCYDGDHTVVKHLVGSFVSAVAAARPQSAPVAVCQVGTNLHGEELVKQFILMQQDATQEGRTVAAIAARLNVTPKYLSELVRQSTGKTAYEVITETTVQAIANQLRYSTLSIKEVAHLLQFDNLSFFGKYCRKHLGLSPTAYRQKYAIGQG